ncbi:MAG: carboxyl transferase domain-containing protein, partial [Acidimicrobiales bacterium]
MRCVESRIDTGSPRYARNLAAYEQLVTTLAERHRWAIDGGPGRGRSIERHLGRGKILVRDRIDLVIDDGSPFLELSTLSGFGQYGDSAPGAGIVTGIGLVHDVPWMFIANDATVKGGSLLPVSIKKHVRAQQIAEENELGVIYLVDSGGAFLPLQDDIFPDKDHFGGSFYRQARLSAAGLPQLSVVLGGCTAGGAYVPALSDEVIMVDGIGRIFLGGPPIVKAALGELIEPDDLGGAELHTRTSGVSDYLADSEREAYGRLREICETTNLRTIHDHQGWIDRTEPEPPAFDPREMYGIVSADDRIPFDAVEIIARLVDGSRFSPFKPEWGESIVCG